MALTLDATGTEDRQDIVDDLNDLLQLDRDAVEAYRETVERLTNEEWAATVRAFQRDHERHVRDLTAMVRRLGGTPAHELPATGAFRKAMVHLGGVGGDRGVLRTFRVNELQVRTKYDVYAAKQAYPGEVATLIRQHAQDEHRHHDWVVTVLGRE